MGHRLIILLSAGLASVLVAGCGFNNVTKEREPDASLPTKSVELSNPHNPADMGILRDLSLAIARDEELRRREISYIVTNGDISVTGVVRTEDERKRINELAMNIGGVKSVANALRVAD